MSDLLTSEAEETLNIFDEEGEEEGSSSEFSDEEGEEEGSSSETSDEESVASSSNPKKTVTKSGSKEKSDIVLVCATRSRSQPCVEICVKVPLFADTKVKRIVCELGVPIRDDLTFSDPREKWPISRYNQGGAILGGHAKDYTPAEISRASDADLRATLESNKTDLSDKACAALALLDRNRDSLRGSVKMAVEVLKRVSDRVEQATLDTAHALWSRCTTLRVRKEVLDGKLEELPLSSDLTDATAKQLNALLWRGDQILEAGHISIMQLAMMGIVNLHTPKAPKKNGISLSLLMCCSALLAGPCTSIKIVKAKEDTSKSLTDAGVIDKGARRTILVVENEV
jgi:hypothetical protein